jgi:hypothetical protein
MNKQIWKYVLSTPPITIEIPKDSKILTVQEQFGEICLWVLVNPTAPKEKRTFEVYGTGHAITYDMGIDRNYISTVQLIGAQLVLHVFEYTGI